MRIAAIETTVVGAPWRELTFVEVVTDDGRRGLGEVRMVNKTDTLVACIAELGTRYAVGADPFDVERIARGFGWEDYGRAGEVVQSALSAIDIACWDLIGQELGVPVWKLLGGRFRERVPAYANGWYQAERDPAAIAERARAVVARGYRGLKLDPFGAASSELSAAERRAATAIVAAVRDAVGPDVALMVELHGRFTGATAAAVAGDLEELAPEWLEEPVPPTDVAGLRRVRAATSLPIATGERIHVVAEFREVIEQGLADVLQADLTHFGGFSGLRRLAGWAEAYNLQLAPHNVCGPVGTAAALHFCVATQCVKVLEHFNDFADPWVGELVDRAPSVDADDGCFGVPGGPGLGLRLNHEACAEHPRTHATLSVFAPGWERRRGHER
jgi:galactonate dehydratase